LSSRATARQGQQFRRQGRQRRGGAAAALATGGGVLDKAGHFGGTGGYGANLFRRGSGAVADVFGRAGLPLHCPAELLLQAVDLDIYGAFLINANLAFDPQGHANADGLDCQ